MQEGRETDEGGDEEGDEGESKTGEKRWYNVDCIIPKTISTSEYCAV